ncbi:unnamed protein product [Rotaria sp. Silwood2]|nr:unnamed protein product [Rotaria sp. Silwood2]CAF3301698.1 unnamed protein product [Rotaria sp. Silwood2]CAF4477244.1 unnamed protein product [Rotaria sp. Silwood2]CAF4500115.1 unnamed protein product [Rotaria sp. Silwood2]
MVPIELQIDKDITLIHDNLSTIAMNMKNCQTIIHEKKISQDLLRIDIVNAKLKYLPVDNLRNLIEQPLSLVDEHNMPLSDELNLIRLSFESDRFYISNDKHKLIILDKNDILLCESITF